LRGRYADNSTVMTDTPKVTEYTPILIQMADSFAVKDEALVTYDLNGDGHDDHIRIVYQKTRYKFTVKFGKSYGGGRTPTFWKPQSMTRDLSFERSMYNNVVPRVQPFTSKGDAAKFYTKNDRGRVTDQIHWSALTKEYPQLTGVLFDHRVQHLAPAFALLFRSASFRGQLHRAIQNGYTFKINGGSGMFLNPVEKTITISASTQLTDFLFIFPHELAHQDIHPEDKTSLGVFINSYAMNEVRPDIFAIKVLGELRIKSDEIWWLNHNLYRAYKLGGEKALLAARKKHIDPRGLTYAEKAYLIFTIPESEDDRFAREAEILATPRHELRSAMGEWQDCFRWQISQKRQTNPAAILDSDTAQNIATKHPRMQESLKTHRKEWIKLFKHLIGPHKDQAAMMVDEQKANVLLRALINDYMDKGLEEIRIANAAKLGIGQYY